MTSERGRMASRDATLFDMLDRAMERAGIPNPEAVYGALSNKLDADLLEKTARYWAKNIVRMEPLGCAGYWVCFPQIKMTRSEASRWVSGKKLEHVPMVRKGEPEAGEYWISLELYGRGDQEQNIAKCWGFVVRNRKMVAKALGDPVKKYGFSVFTLQGGMTAHDVEWQLGLQNYKLIGHDQLERVQEWPVLTTSNKQDHDFDIMRASTGTWVSTKRLYGRRDKDTPPDQLANPPLKAGMRIYAERWIPERPTGQEIHDAKVYMFKRNLPCLFSSVETCRHCEFTHTACEADK